MKKRLFQIGVSCGALVLLSGCAALEETEIPKSLKVGFWIVLFLLILIPLLRGAGFFGSGKKDGWKNDGSSQGWWIGGGDGGGSGGSDFGGGDSGGGGDGGGGGD